MTQAATAGERAEALAACTMQLVDVESVSGNEAALADLVEAELRGIGLGDRVVRRGDTVLTVPRRVAGRPHVLLVGHLDTVPPQDNLPARRDGDVLYGLGTADMKGSLAVQLAVMQWVADGAATAVDVDVLFYDSEELPVARSPLPGVFAEHPEVLATDLAVVMEPTAQALQLGCLGNLGAEVAWNGVSCHSARPWLGENAVHKAVRALSGIAAHAPQPDDIDGLVFTEVANVTTITGGLAHNVIPDRVEAHVNFRWSPRRSAAEAEEFLRGLLHADEFTVASNSPGAMPCADNPLLRALRRSGPDGPLAVEAKQAWTDVAQFSAAGVDAVNFGPGDPRWAHTRDEQVSVTALAESFATLQRFLAHGPAGEER